MEKFVLTSTIYHMEKELVFYGIALVKETRGSYELIKAVNDISRNKSKVQELVDSCNKSSYSQEQLLASVQVLLADNC